MKKLKIRYIIILLTSILAANGAANVNDISELLSRCTIVTREQYRKELWKFAEANDTTGFWHFTRTAYWGKAAVSDLLPSKPGILMVMRASSAEDARWIRDRGTTLIAAGLRGDNDWVEKGEVREFGTSESPIILLRFGEIIVSLSEIGNPPVEEKKTLLRLIESKVKEWRIQKADEKKNEPNEALQRSRLPGANRAFSSLREGTIRARQPAR